MDPQTDIQADASAEGSPNGLNPEYENAVQRVNVLRQAINPATQNEDMSAISVSLLQDPELLCLDLDDAIEYLSGRILKIGEKLLIHSGDDRNIRELIQKHKAIAREHLDSSHGLERKNMYDRFLQVCFDYERIREAEPKMLQAPERALKAPMFGRVQRSTVKRTQPRPAS
jgi:hypothetical protein